MSRLGPEKVPGVIQCFWMLQIAREEGSSEGELYHRCMERARQLNLVPGDILFRKVFCYTRKDDDCRVHCVARVPVHLPE